MALVVNKDGSPSARLANAYVRLSKSASALNTASDALGLAVSATDEQLRALNLGVAAWVTLEHESNDEAEMYRQKSLGYDKVDGKWGIALRDESGPWDDPDSVRQQTWHFNDAPRQLRLLALSKLPELFEELVKQADETAAAIELATATAQQIAESLKLLAGASKVKGER